MLTQQMGKRLLSLARETIESKLGMGEKSSTEEDLSASSALAQHLGVFVTLHIGEELRGCIGSLIGTESILAGVRHHAINAAFEDYRFAPLRKEEVEKIRISVSVLSDPQKLEYGNPDELTRVLRPGIDGVLLRSPSGAGATFLPQVWEQLPLPEMFLSHLCRKAGLADDYWRNAECEVKTYQVQYFEENR